MAYKLIITQSFEDDLDEVLYYISRKLYNPSAAKRLLNKTKEVISHIEDNPLLYTLYHDEALAKRGYRYAVVANYLLFYYIYEAEQTVNVARFLYGGQNVVNII